MQFLPPFLASNFVRVLLYSPFPQVTEQLPHGLHEPHWQLTGGGGGGTLTVPEQGDLHSIHLLSMLGTPSNLDVLNFGAHAVSA